MGMVTGMGIVTGRRKMMIKWLLYSRYIGMIFRIISYSISLTTVASVMSMSSLFKMGKSMRWSDVKKVMNLALISSRRYTQSFLKQFSECNYLIKEY